jgi:peptidyl-prolyl cis-trans isomerase B (cyclophilin B)
MKQHYNFFKILLIFSACFFSMADLLAQWTFTGKPMYQVLSKRPSGPIGTFTLELFPNIAPYHVTNFDSLVSTKFYDTTAFHRVIPGFVIQGGDPNSRHGPKSTWGFGQPSQPKVKAEFSVAKHVRGILSAARQANNINSATSQFFICVATASSLDGQYSIYGRVTHGMDIVDSIVLSPRDSKDNPLVKIEMFITAIGSNDTVPVKPTLQSPPNNTVGLATSVVSLKWNKVNDGIFYQVHVSHDSLFSDTVKLADVAGLQYNLTSLPVATQFFWKVRVNNGGHYATSQTWNFTTVSPVGISKNNLQDAQATVFPNPSKDKFSFSNLVPGSTLLITDLAGRKVSEIPVTEKDQIIDLGDKARGSYLFKLSRNGKELQQGKLILQ